MLLPLYIAIDTETTGLLGGPSGAYPIEIAAVEVSNPKESFCERIRTTAPIEPAAVLVHNIVARDLVSCRDEESVIKSFIEFLSARASANSHGEQRPITLVAHNSWFDSGVILAALARWGLALPAGTVWHCTISL